MKFCPLFLFSLILLPLTLGGASFYIGPEGSDEAGDGTLQNPWRTLEKARDHLRTFTTQTEDLEVLLLPGRYARESAFQLSFADSGRSGYNRIYRAADGPGSVEISGGYLVTENWTDLGDGLWQANLQAGLDIKTLYVDDMRYHLARYPNRNTGVLRELYPLSLAPYLTSTGGGVSGEISYINAREGEVDASLFAEDCLINIWPFDDHNWNFWSLKVTQYTGLANGGRIYFDNLGDGTDIGRDARFFLSGSLAMLDAKEEFHYNNSTGVLTVFMETGMDPNNREVVVPLLDTLVSVEGSPFALQTVSRVRFDGLTFEHTRATIPSVQWWSTDYGRSDTGIFTLRHSERIEIINCLIRFAGRHGILMTTSTNRLNLVENSLIAHTGISGITLTNRITDFSGDVRDNTIRNVGVYATGELGVDAASITLFNTTSNLVQNVLISDSSRYGISIRGNVTMAGSPNSFPPASNNLVEYALIRNTNQDSGDGGGYHMAGVNGISTNNINTLRQSIIEDTRSVLGQNDPQPPRGIFLDWKRANLDQVFENVELINAEGLAYETNENPEQSFNNVSWQPGFDETQMERDLIGLTDAFPYEFPLAAFDRDWSRDLVVDQSNPLFTEFGSGWQDSSTGRQDLRDGSRNKSRFNSTADGASYGEWSVPITSDGYYRLLIYKYDLSPTNSQATPFELKNGELSLNKSFLFGTDGPRWEEWQTEYLRSDSPTTVRIYSHTAGARADTVRFIRADARAQTSDQLLLDNIVGIKGNTVDGFGYRFSLAEAVQLESLGVWQGSLENGPVLVELKAYPGGEVLASTVISGGGSEAFYIYERLDQPINLSGGTTYELVATTTDSNARTFLYGLAPEGGDMINTVKAHSFDPVLVTGGATALYGPRGSDPANRVEVLLGPNLQFATESDTWAGFPVLNGAFVDSGPFLGWLYVGQIGERWDWVYAYALSKYIFLPEDSAASAGGSWIWIPKP